MATLQFTDLFDEVCDRTGFPRDEVRLLGYEFLRALALALDAGNDVRINNIGHFHWDIVDPHTFHNVISGKMERQPAGRKLRFKPCPKLRNRRRLE